MTFTVFSLVSKRLANNLIGYCGMNNCILHKFHVETQSKGWGYSSVEHPLLSISVAQPSVPQINNNDNDKKQH